MREERARADRSRALLLLALAACRADIPRRAHGPGDTAGETAEALLSDSADTGDSADSAESSDPLLIIGGGVAGLSVAIAAGRGVLLEADTELGGRARWTSGLLTCIGCPELPDASADDTVDRAVSQWPGMTGGEATDTTRAFLEGSLGIHDALFALGIRFDAFPRATTRGTPRLVTVIGDEGTLPATLAAAVPPAVEVRLNTTVDEVVVEQGRATGVRVGGEFLPASAVVIASGGFAGDADALASLVGPKDGSWDSSPVAGATGDALAWADAQGWSTSRRDAVGWYYGTISASTDHQPLHLSYNPNGMHPWIWVDSAGKRFFDETDIWSLVVSTVLSEHEGVWAMAPERTLLRSINTDELDDWNSLVAEGTKALCEDDATSLARATGVDPVTLQHTLDVVGRVRARGSSDLYGRPDASFPDYSEGPLCAWRPGRVALKTFGGLDVDEEGRVLDGDGEPIENLYAVGEAAGMAAPGTGGAHGFDGSLMAILWSGQRVGAALAH